MWTLESTRLSLHKEDTASPTPRQAPSLRKKMRPNVNTAKPAILGQARDSHSCQLNTASYYKKYKKKRTYCGGWPHNTGFPLNIEAEISVISYPQPNTLTGLGRGREMQWLMISGYLIWDPCYSTYSSLNFICPQNNQIPSCLRIGNVKNK